MKVSILITGSEFATGTKQDANSIFFAKEVFERGLNVTSIHLCQDNIQEIADNLNCALKSNDIIIVSGGLGPTFDDVTREALSKALNDKLVFDKDWLEYLTKDYKKRNIDLTPIRKKMAQRLLNSKPIPNKHGKALGFVYQKENKTVVVLPGIPHEAKDMFNEAFAQLGFDKRVRQIHLLRTFGLKESDVSELTKNFEGVFLNVSPKGTDVYSPPEYIDELSRKFGNFVYAQGNIEMEEVVGELLKKNNLTIACAESSTGGFIVSRLINVVGSSIYCLGGIVSYSNQAKIQLLGVKKDTLEQFGAVSEQTAKEMLLGAKKLFNADIVLCDTGIAGPQGASKQKPLGLHYIGIIFQDNIEIYRDIYQAERNYTRLYISQFALNLVRLKLHK